MVEIVIHCMEELEMCQCDTDASVWGHCMRKNIFRSGREPPTHIHWKWQGHKSSVGPDQLFHQTPADLKPHHLQNRNSTVKSHFKVLGTRRYIQNFQ